MKTIIDCDPGHDDALALMLAVKSPEIDLELVTTTAGNAEVEKTARNARHILDIAGSDAPVYSGSEKPLERELETADVHGESGLEGLEPIPESSPSKGAVEAMADTIRGSGNQVRLVALGPLTNVARLIEEYPSVEEGLEEIVTMGGAIEVPGNQNRVAEYNMYVDPEAASKVIESEVEKKLVPLDSCNHVVLNLRDLEHVNSGLSEPIKAMMIPYIRNIQDYLDVEGALMYDALAVYAAMAEVDFREMDVKIETEGEHTRGMTVADRRVYHDKKPNCKVPEKISTDDFKKTLIETLNRGN